MNLSAKDIKLGARYDYNYLALPAIMTGKCLLVAPEIIVSDSRADRGAPCDTKIAHFNRHAVSGVCCGPK